MRTPLATANAFQPAYGGGIDAFVAQLDPAGSTLIYSTYLGGSGFDEGYGIAVNGDGNDAFVAKLAQPLSPSRRR